MPSKVRAAMTDLGIEPEPIEFAKYARIPEIPPEHAALSFSRRARQDLLALMAHSGTGQRMGD
jgi:hypothetical protein